MKTKRRRYNLCGLCGQPLGEVSVVDHSTGELIGPARIGDTPQDHSYCFFKTEEAS